MAKGSPSGQNDTRVVLVYSTFPDMEGARRAADALVRGGLAACVNMLPGMRSVYAWEGAVEEAEETVFIAKTGAERATEAMDAIRRAHPYDEPALMVIPVAGGSASYLEWILAASRGTPPAGG